jgi:hypothetical protein
MKGYWLNRRVKIAAWTDLFMRGERYATVTKVGRKILTVRGDRSGRTFKFRIPGDEANPALEIV